MIGLDTNLVVRLFTQDDPAQYQRALRLLKDLPQGEKAIVNLVVVVELIWVLRKAYQYGRRELARVIRVLTEHKKLHLPDKDLLREAAHRALERGGDIPDHIIALLNISQSARTTYTFDAEAAFSDDFTLLT
jgi:predicted nucleic-acid-binding protein